jgi:hypothetical protein
MFQTRDKTPPVKLTPTPSPSLFSSHNRRNALCHTMAAILET